MGYTYTFMQNCRKGKQNFRSTKSTNLNNHTTYSYGEIQLKYSENSKMKFDDRLGWLRC